MQYQVNIRYKVFIDDFVNGLVEDKYKNKRQKVITQDFTFLKIGLWRALLAKRIVGPLFFERIVICFVHREHI